MSSFSFRRCGLSSMLSCHTLTRAGVDAAWAGACIVWLRCVDVCARRCARSRVWMCVGRHVAAARTWCASQLVASGVVQQDGQWQPAAGVHTEPRSSSLLPVHYISEHRISSTAAVAAGVTGQGGPGDTQLVERGTIVPYGTRRHAHEARDVGLPTCLLQPSSVCSRGARLVINSGPERTPPSARPSRDGRVPQPARTNCLFTFLILCVPVIALATSERGVHGVCHEAISCARDSPPTLMTPHAENARANSIQNQRDRERYPKGENSISISLGVHPVWPITRRQGTNEDTLTELQRPGTSRYRRGPELAVLTGTRSESKFYGVTFTGPSFP